MTDMKTSGASSSRPSTTEPHGRAHAFAHSRPAAAGLLAAVGSLLTGAERASVGITVAIAATCYFAAAALDRPWAAWAAIPGCAVLIVAGGLLGAPPLVTLAVLAAVLAVASLAVRGPGKALTVEGAGLLGYGGLVVLGFALAPTAGLVLVAVTLVAHAAWDVAHLRRAAVVPRSMAEFCVVLDVLLGVGVLVRLLAG